jgi:hypothetical protein
MKHRATGWKLGVRESVAGVVSWRTVEDCWGSGEEPFGAAAAAVRAGDLQPP